MRTFKLIGAALAVLAIAALAAATASAEEILWKWLPGKVGERFKGSSGKVTWQIEKGGSIACKSTTLGAKVGELLKEGSTEEKDATLALAILEFSGCTALGLTASGLSDEPGIITVHVEIHNCLIKEKDYGLLLKPLPVHIEIDETGLLFDIQGDAIALAEPEGTQPTKNWHLNVKQKGGLQEIKLCEGNSFEEQLETSTDGGAFMVTGLELKEFKLEFEKAAQEAMV